MLVSQTFGVASSAVLVVVTGEAQPPMPALGWAALSGLTGVCGLVFFYRALSVGSMALVAPLAGIISAALPATIAIAGGERLSELRGLGLLVALGAIVLISFPRRGRADGPARHMRRSDFALSALAGLGFAGFFLFLDFSVAEGGQSWWPLLVLRGAGLVGLLTALAVALARGSLTRVLGIEQYRASVARLGALAVVPLFVGAGMGDMFGNLFFLIADHTDALAVAVVLSSLYPVMTAILAAVFLHERLSRLQLLGVLGAATAAGLIGVG
jgi:drug/metabolite transporter (DMT)-like permease